MSSGQRSGRRKSRAERTISRERSSRRSRERIDTVIGGFPGEDGTTSNTIYIIFTPSAALHHTIRREQALASTTAIVGHCGEEIWYR